MGMLLACAGAASAGSYLAAIVATLVRPSWLGARTSLPGAALMLMGFAVLRAMPEWAFYAAPFALAGATIATATARGALQIALVGPLALAIVSLAAATFVPAASAAMLRDTGAVMLALPGPLVAAIVAGRWIATTTLRRSQT